MKAIQSGMAVVASPILWMVSARSATEPEITTTASCKAAVMARIMKDHLMAQMPRSVVAIVGSTTRRAYDRGCRHDRDRGHVRHGYDHGCRHRSRTSREPRPACRTSQVL